MKSGNARYDGHADWYDETFSAYSTAEEAGFLRECLGSGGGGICLDVACGTGLYGRLIADAGYRGVGFDISADQLRFARRRLAVAVRAANRAARRSACRYGAERRRSDERTHPAAEPNRRIPG